MTASAEETELQISSRQMSRADMRLWITAQKQLKKKLGRAPDAEDFVDFAKTAAGKPIHHLFNWDDREAAHKYRVQQAGYYCRAIQVEWGPEHDRIRMLHMVTDQSGNRGYDTVDQALGRPSAVEEVLADAKRDLETFRLKYERLVVVTGNKKVLRDVLEQVKALLARKDW